ncbi:hypothetical protein ABT294_25695 [Nonomuraea sp. NPDC000554]
MLLAKPELLFLDERDDLGVDQNGVRGPVDLALRVVEAGDCFTV